MILSGDARFVSFNPVVYTQDWQPLGSRLYIHDRLAGTTMLIGEQSVLQASTRKASRLLPPVARLILAWQKRSH
jgi:hypothetical protein